MIKAFMTRKVAAAIIGSMVTALSALLASRGISVGAETLSLWQEGLIAAAGIGISAWAGTDTPISSATE